MTTITTLIPAYKKTYLAETFLGLQRQNFRDFRVILSDDSPDDEITQLIRGGHFGALIDGLDLEIVRGPKNARLNQRALLDRWNGTSPLVHLHLDDDLIFPDFYRQHVEAHASGVYSVSVSRRWLSQEDTVPVQGFELPDFVQQSPLRFVPVSHTQMLQSMVPVCANWMGEFSNMVLSAQGAHHYPRPPSDALTYYGWPDVGFLLEAGQHAPAVVVREHLGVFRGHAEQTTHHMHNHGGRVSSMAWTTCALLGWRQGHLTDQQAVQAVCRTVADCLKRYGEDDPLINEFYALVQHQGTDLRRLYTAFEPFWLRLLASDGATAPDGSPHAAKPLRPTAPTTPAAAAQAMPPAESSMDALRRAMAALVPV